MGKNSTWPRSTGSQGGITAKQVAADRRGERGEEQGWCWWIRQGVIWSSHLPVSEVYFDPLAGYLHVPDFCLHQRTKYLFFAQIHPC